MKVIIVGDAVVSTGFSRCSHALADELHKRGHDVGVLGMNYWGDPHKYPYAIFPCFSPIDGCRSRMGTDRLPKLIHRFSPDAVVIINDPWNIKAYFDDMDATLEDGYELPKMIGWLAVDGANQKLGALDRLDHIVVWTRFAEEEIIKAGYKGATSIVPLGVNPDIFKPIPQLIARRSTLPQTDDVGSLFVVGVVGRNQHRKRMDLTIAAFARAWELAGRDPLWRLFLHVAPTGDSGYDLKALCNYYNVREVTLISKPDIGQGLDERLLPHLYSSFNVYLSMSQGEGWGLPAQEAMACEVPCVLPNWGSFGPGGWVSRDEAYLIDCPVQLATAPVDGMLHTMGGVPDVWEAANAILRINLEGSYKTPMTERAAVTARRLSSHLTGINMADVVESVVK